MVTGGTKVWSHAGLSIQTLPLLIDIPAFAWRLRNNEVVVLDIEDYQEWRAEYVSGSIHVPYQQMKEGVPKEVRSVGRTLAVVCLSGIRRSLAASLLKQAGLSNVEHLTYGGVPELEDEVIELVKET